jgi:hypothetical protein
VSRLVRSLRKRKEVPTAPHRLPPSLRCSIQGPCRDDASKCIQRRKLISGCQSVPGKSCWTASGRNGRKAQINVVSRKMFQKQANRATLPESVKNLIAADVHGPRVSAPLPLVGKKEASHSSGRGASHSYRRENSHLEIEAATSFPGNSPSARRNTVKG